MRKAYYLITVLAGLFLMSSCDLAKKLTTAKIPVGDFDVKFDMPIDNAIQKTRAGEVYEFKGEYTLTSDDPYFSEVAQYEKYKKNITDMTFEKISMVISCEEYPDAVISDLSLSVVDINNNIVSVFELEKYNLGNEHVVSSLSDPLIITFQAAIDQILNNDKVTFKATGYSSIPEGTLNFSLLIEELTVYASLITR